MVLMIWIYNSYSRDCCELLPAARKKNPHKVRGDFETQPAVDRWFSLVLVSCHCLEQYTNHPELDGTASQPLVRF